MLLKRTSIVTVSILLFLTVKLYAVKYIVEGYAEKRSYYQGDTVKLYINATGAYNNIQLKINTINEVVVDSFNISIKHQAITNANPARNGFGYGLSGVYIIPKSLPSGIYNIEKKIFLIVKKANRKSDIVVVYPSSSEEAYNNSGNRKSTYPFNSNGTPETMVSFQRPLSPFAIDSVRLWSSAFLKWIDKKKVSNYSIRYIADIDMEEYDEIKDSKILVVIGHSEYWSRNGRMHLDRFVNEGKSAVILSGNTMWWQIRYSSDKTKLICYKENADPVENPLLRTINWGAKSLNYQPLFSIGADFSNSGYGLKHGNGWLGYKVAVANSPLFEGTGLEKGDIISCPSYEMDGTLLKGIKNGYPEVDNDSLKFCQVEVVGFDFTQCHAKGCQAVGTFVIFKKYLNSGNVINVASMDWCAEKAFWFAPETGGMGGKDSLKLRKITENIFEKTLSNSNIYTSLSTKYCRQNTDAINETEDHKVAFAVYPNPGEGHLFVDSPEGSDCSFYLTDIEGRLLLIKEKLSGLHNEVLVDKIESGIYYYRIFCNNTSMKAGKIIIQK